MLESTNMNRSDKSISFLPKYLDRWRDSKVLIENMYVEFDRLITGPNNSRNCTSKGVVQMMGYILDSGYDRSSRFLAYPHHGELLVKLLQNKFIFLK